MENTRKPFALSHGRAVFYGCGWVWIESTHHHSRISWKTPLSESLLTCRVVFVDRTLLSAGLHHQAGEGSSDYQRVVQALPRESLKRAYQEIETRLAEVRLGTSRSFVAHEMAWQLLGGLLEREKL